MIPKVGASYLRLLGYRSALEQGRCFHYGIHVRRHFNRARRCYHQAWREGDHRALDYLIALEHRLGHRGEAYLGCGLKYETERQWSMALTCYGLALEYHHEGALLRLSMLYQADRYDSTERCVIPRDDRQAMRWLQYGAMQGSKHALDRLLTLSQDMGQAAYALGELMEDKRFAGKKTPSSAVSYYLQAAQLTHGAEGLADLHRLRAYWTEEMKNAIAHGHLQHARSFTSARPDHHRRTAIHLFYERTNQGDETAQQQLLQMGQAKAQEAWWIGQLY